MALLVMQCKPHNATQEKFKPKLLINRLIQDNKEQGLDTAATLFSGLKKKKKSKHVRMNLSKGRARVEL